MYSSDQILFFVFHRLDFNFKENEVNKLLPQSLQSHLNNLLRIASSYFIKFAILIIGHLTDYFNYI